MAKARKIIPRTVLASVLSIPAVTFAHDTGPMATKQELAAPGQPKLGSYHDSTFAATEFGMSFKAVIARVQAQHEGFNLYGGARSSSDMRPPARLASAKRVESDS